MAEAALAAENSSENSAKNVPGRPFEKGRSGNPGGRPKGLARAVRDRLQEAAPEGKTGEDVLVAFWTTVMADAKATYGERLKASQFLSERGWGKPPVFAPIEDEDPLGTSEAEAEQIAAGFDARLDELSERRKQTAKA